MFALAGGQQPPSNITSLGITALLLFVAALLMIRLSGKIQHPLGRITSRIATLADGNLHERVDVEYTKDETETLSSALSHTVQSINRYTSELSRVLTELSRSNLDVSVDGEFHGDFIVMKNSLSEIIEFLNEIMHSIQQAAVQVSSTSIQVSQNALRRAAAIWSTRACATKTPRRPASCCARWRAS